MEAGWTGIIKEPFLLIDIQGKGTVKIRNKIYKLDSIKIKRILNKSEVINEFEVVDSQSEIKAVYLLNPLVANFEIKNHLKIIGKEIDSLEVDTISIEKSKQFKFGKYRSKNFERDLILLNKADIKYLNPTDKTMKAFKIIDFTLNEQKNILNNLKIILGQVNNEGDNSLGQLMQNNDTFLLILYKLKRSPNNSITGSLINYLNKQ